MELFLECSIHISTYPPIYCGSVIWIIFPCISLSLSIYKYLCWTYDVSKVSIYLSIHLSFYLYYGSIMGAVFLFIYISIYLSIYSFWECSGSDLSIYPWCPHQGQKHTHVDLGACCMVICSMGTLANPFASRGDHGDLMGGPHFWTKCVPRLWFLIYIYRSIYLPIYLHIYLFIYLSIYPFWECSASDLYIYLWCPHPGEKHTHVDLGEHCMGHLLHWHTWNSFLPPGEIMGGPHVWIKCVPGLWFLISIYLSIYLYMNVPIYLFILKVFWEWPVYRPLVSPARGEAYPCRFGWT
jgi:hypothetical protein